MLYVYSYGYIFMYRWIHKCSNVLKLFEILNLWVFTKNFYILEYLKYFKIKSQEAQIEKKQTLWSERKKFTNHTRSSRQRISSSVSVSWDSISTEQLGGPEDSSAGRKSGYKKAILNLVKCNLLWREEDSMPVLYPE